MTEPTDDELDAAMQLVLRCTDARVAWYADATDATYAAWRNSYEAVRATLAKWGQPAGAGEPMTARELADRVARGEQWRIASTPHPTQAQAGAVPLPRFLALKFHARRDKKATVTLLFPGHEAADAWVRGIKGGQHGAE